MNAQAAIGLTALAITILAGSDTLKAEYFTNFEISPVEVLPGSHTVTVKNVGWAQADNAVLQIIADGTIVNYVDKCVEGNVQQLIDNNTLVVEFSRMSPKIECDIELTISESGTLEMMISSDGRLEPWASTASWPTVTGFLVLWIVVIMILSLVVWWATGRLSENELFNNIEFWWYQFLRRLFHLSKFRITDNVEKTVEFVRSEYGLIINKIDATILELIYQQKTTMLQLRNHSKLSLQQVQYRVRKLRRDELIRQEKMELDKTLNDYFVHLEGYGTYPN